MTESTDTKNITKIVRAILQENGIDNLQVEIDMITAWKRYLFEREKGETPAIARERVTKDYVSAVLEVARAGQDRIAYQRRVESVLGLTPNWDDLKQDWNGFDMWLMNKEKAGQTIEAFMKWYNSDEFRSKGRIWLNPSKIKMIWGNAFETKTDEARPEYKQVQPETIKAVPNPLSKPRLT